METRVLFYWFKTRVGHYVSITTLWCLHGGGTASTLPVSLHFRHSFLPIGRSHPCDPRPRWLPHLGSAHQTTSGTTETERENWVILAMTNSIFLFIYRVTCRHYDQPACIWPRQQLASVWGSWRWDAGLSQPADLWGGSCTGHAEGICGTAVWSSQSGDCRPGPSERPGVD